MDHRSNIRARAHTFVAGTLFALALALVSLAALHSPAAHAQTLHYAHKPDPVAGEAVYKGGCIACHGARGDGADQNLTVFLRPQTWPDFTKCDQTTPEPDSNWKAVIVHGGPNRAFSQIMPAFDKTLSDDQINDVIAYMRGFCKRADFPRGELNLPRAIATEKAFPEEELVASTAASATGAPTWTTDIIREHTFGGRNQLEVDVPINYNDVDGHYDVGVGDITVGLKRELWYSLHTGSILSAQGGILLPTGDKYRGFGAGTPTFEPFVAFDQLFRENTFFQFQLGGDVPFNTDYTPRSMFGRLAVGQALAQDHGLGRMFSPMVELLSARDFTPGASINWDILPQMQVTVSRRQHIRAAVGYRDPLNNTDGRNAQVTFYVLWDIADGKLWKGWK